MASGLGNLYLNYGWMSIFFDVAILEMAIDTENRRSQSDRNGESVTRR
jgi:hypothetical protein